MSYEHIRKTALAKRTIEEIEEARRSALLESSRIIWSRDWLDDYLGRNKPAEQPLETNHDDQDRREATGTEAGPVSAGEGVGDPPGEQVGSGAAEEPTQAAPVSDREVLEGCRLDDPGNEANWIDDAYPEGSQGADFTNSDRTPF